MHILYKGFGENVQIAHVLAARDALRIRFETTENMKPFNFAIPVSDEVENKIEKKNL